jgi:flagellar basal-body rod protein FlgC
MIDGLHAAYSGLVTSGRKAGVSAHNVANGNTGDFRKKRLVAESLEEGGVTSSIEEVPGAGPGPVEGVTRSESSNVDLGEEIVEFTVAQRTFEANAASLKTEEEILGTLLDIMA